MATQSRAAPIVGRPRHAPRRATAAEAVPSREDALLTIRWRRLFGLLAVVLRGLHACAAPLTADAEGRAYLGSAAAYLRGVTALALDTSRGPLYSWLLVGPVAFRRLAPSWQGVAVRAVNGFLLLAALAAFEWLLSELLLCRRGAAAAARARWQETTPDWCVAGFASSLFACVSLQLVPPSAVAPDLSAAAAVLAASALRLRLRRLGPNPFRSMLLGTLLALA